MCIQSPSIGQKIARGLLLPILALGLVACDLSPDPCDQLDSRWHRQDLVAGNLLPWLRAAPTPSGFFRSKMARDWTPMAGNSVELTAQTRMIYTMVRGWDATRDRRYLDAATSGGDFLLAHFTDPDFPGFLPAVRADGSALGSTKKTYGHAFAIFALAHLHRVTGDERYGQAGLQAWGWLQRYLMDAHGGFAQAASRDMQIAAGRRNQNPVMHLFEAMVALWEATGDQDAYAGARMVGDFVVERLVVQRPRDAYIPEWYSNDWQPLTGGQGGYIDLGHQFEWAYLFSAAAIRGLPEHYAQVGEQVLDFALREGYDEVSGGCFKRLRPNGGLNKQLNWWPQSETLRALMHYAALRGRADLWPRYRQTLELVQREFADPVNRGWYPKPLPDCGDVPCRLPQAGYGYHVASMHMEALELSAQCRAR